MILCVDGNNIAFACNAVSRLSTPDGRPAQAIFNFLRSMHTLCETYQPRKLFVAWDGGRSKRRMDLHPGYKASRGKDLKPQQQLLLDEFKLQAPIIQENIPYLGAYSIQGPGVEADDLIATLALLSEKRGEDFCIVSSDKDFLQLVSPLISVCRSGTGEKLINQENMEKSFGLRPDQWLEYRCLTGDTSDEIKGIPSVGEKTAGKVLKAYGCLDNLFKAAEVLPAGDKRIAAILAGADIIERNKKLMGLRNIDPELIKTARIKSPEFNPLKLKALFKSYSFNTLLFDFSRWLSVFNCLESVSGACREAI